MKCLACIGLILLLSACAQPKQLYNYGGYSDNYYKLKKQTTPENKKALMECIEKAISEAGKSQSGRVPPGMFANLGYLYLQDGNSQRAISLFEKEKETYPESSQFMERIIAKVEHAEKEGARQ